MIHIEINDEEMNTGDATTKLPDVKPFPKEIISTFEKEMLGVYITEHPLNDYAAIMDKVSSANSDFLSKARQQIDEGLESDVSDGDKVAVAGLITNVKTLITKNNKMMAFVEIEDLYGVMEVIIFPNVYQKSSHLIKEDEILAIKGVVNFKEDENPKILADSVRNLKEIESLQAINKAPLKIKLPDSESEQEILEKIRKVLITHKGDTPIIIYRNNGKAFKTERDLWVTVDEDFMKTMEGLVGTNNVK